SALDRHALAGDAQAGLAQGAGENRLVLQFGEGEVVGDLAEDLGEGRVEGGADRRQQLGGRLLAAALHLRQVTERHSRGRGHLAQSATLPDAQPTQHVAEQLTKQNHRRTPFLMRNSLPGVHCEVTGSRPLLTPPYLSVRYI